MGLDIFISVDNKEQVFADDYHNESNDYFHKHGLSREFCNFICRRNVVEDIPELDQIGEITGIDITPIYEMDSYPDEEGIEFELEFAENEGQRDEIRKNAEVEKGKLKGNLDTVLETVNSLIEKLEGQESLYQLLIPTDFDSLNSAYYFSGFKSDKGDGYIGNSFGQDLRNFKRFLEFAKERGSNTVWFNYG